MVRTPPHRPQSSLQADPSCCALAPPPVAQELKARNIAHARNLFDRAVTLLPRIDQIWYKYVFLEELLGNVAGARQVFERWMAWQPDDKAWSAYIKMEVRYSELDRASKIYERMVDCHPEPKHWVKWAKFEEERSQPDRARAIYQMGFEYFGDDEEGIDKSQSLYSAMAKMEVRLKEYDRARAIYKVRAPSPLALRLASPRASKHALTRSLRPTVRPRPSPALALNPALRGLLQL